jgi:hypothetical protein
MKHWLNNVCLIIYLGVLIFQYIVGCGILSASDDSSPESIFVTKYSFNPRNHYVFAGHSYQGLDIKEQDIEYIVKSLKTIDLSSETTDQIIKLYGLVHEKSTKGGTHEWKYNFLFSRELNSQQKSDLERLTKEYNVISRYVVCANANALDDNEIRGLTDLGFKAGEMRRPDFISLLEVKMKAINEKTMAIQLTQKQTLVQIIFRIGTTGKIKSIDLNKITDDGSSSCLYIKSSEDENDASSVNNQKMEMPKDVAFSEAPPNPYPGMIYLNTSEKHFYGWDGTSWLKMDMKP